MFVACVESLFFQSGSLIWFLFVVSVFGLRLQASAHEIWKPAVALPDAEPVHA